ncbi:DUF5134 domain-containing protein [Dactylosporangium cerinum]|uniref:DUF5134 domain-containing protein n=1 Tax=Dactylosporangium cerinum TaxID=1434730 RepID=A0ABV9WJH8_9ACTN
MFGAAGLMLFTGNGSDPLSRGIHVAGCAAMILASWSWASKLPVWPQEAVFTLAAGWFFVRAVHGPRLRVQSGGQRWRDLHHAVMAGAITWSAAGMTDPHSTAEHIHSSMPAQAANPAGVDTTAVLTVYFVAAALPWLSAAFRAAWKSDHREPQRRRHAVEAASHGLMSIGMAAMFLAMA